MAWIEWAAKVAIGTTSDLVGRTDQVIIFVHHGAGCRVSQWGAGSANKHDVPIVSAGRDYAWFGKTVPDTISAVTDRTAQHHIVQRIDGNQAIWAGQPLVVDESAVQPTAAQKRQQPKEIAPTHTRSITIAMPCPTPMHIVQRA